MKSTPPCDVDGNKWRAKAPVAECALGSAPTVRREVWTHTEFLLKVHAFISSTYGFYYPHGSTEVNCFGLLFFLACFSCFSNLMPELYFPVQLTQGDAFWKYTWTFRCPSGNGACTRPGMYRPSVWCPSWAVLGATGLPCGTALDEFFGCLV